MATDNPEPLKSGISLCCKDWTDLLVSLILTLHTCICLASATVLKNRSLLFAFKSGIKVK